MYTKVQYYLLLPTSHLLDDVYMMYLIQFYTIVNCLYISHLHKYESELYYEIKN